MKTNFISLSVCCALSVVGFGESANVPISEYNAKNQTNRLTHIVKLKTSSISNLKDFEATTFIKNHYTTFQQISGSLKEKNEAFSFDPAASDIPSSLNQIEDITIGNDFKALAGNFHHAFANYLSSLDDIEYVEPNRIYKTAILPITSVPEPYLSKKSKIVQNVHSAERYYEKRDSITQENVPSWGISRINHRNLGDAMSYTMDEGAGSGVNVFIFDTGISPEHPDFSGRASAAANFVDYEDEFDQSGHGTHVAGTIGGTLFGVAKNANLHSVKILDKTGDGETISLLRALSYVSKVAERGKTLINLSLSGPRSQPVDDAIDMIVEQHGVPIFVSAGNDGDNACDHSPSANPKAFSVGASTAEDNVPSFSGYGSCVSLYAPGTNIASTWLDGQVQVLDGTSMANPHVSGIAAVLMSQYSFNTAHEVYDALKSIATAGVLKSTHPEDNTLLAFVGPST